MWRWLIILILVGTAFAQRPALRQAACADNGVVAFANNVVSGNLIYVFTQWDSGVGTMAVTDTRGTSYTNGTKVTGSGSLQGQAAFGAAAGSGANTVTVTGIGTFWQTCIAEFTGTTATKDVDATQTGTSTPATISQSLTTANNGELVVAGVGGFQSAGVMIQDQPAQWIAMHNGNDSIAAGYDIAGIAGSKTVSFHNFTNSNVVMTITAFVPNTINITTASLHTASTTTAYSEQLQAVGGSGAYTFSVVSGALPPGLSMTSGGLITGTPTASAAGSIGFQVTDGTHTSATATMALTVGTSVNTVANVQSNSNSGAATLAFGSNVTSGNCLIASYDDPASVSNAAAALRSITDSRSTSYTPVLSGGAFNGTQIFVGTAPSSGANTVTFPVSTNIHISEWSGTQCTPDVFSLANGQNGTVGSTALTTITANSLLVSAAGGFRSATTFTVGGSFSNVTFKNTNGALSVDKNTSTTTGSYSSSYTMGGSGADYWNVSLLAFRPSTSGTAPSSGNCAACDMSGALMESIPLTPRRTGM